MEGRKSIHDALAGGATVETVYLDRAAADEAEAGVASAAAAAGAELVEVQPGVLSRACDTVTPQPVAATVRMLDVGLAELAARRPSFVAVLVGIGDPGNAGSLLRSVAAAGGGAAVLAAGSVDLYNPKTVRASAGAIFRLAVAAGATEDEILAQLRGRAIRVLAAVAAKGVPYTDVDLSGPVAVLLGNEAHGLSRELVEAADTAVTIPTEEGTESLGVAAAGAVLCFEAARQRRLNSVAGAA